jgi:hypothetical protein
MAKKSKSKKSNSKAKAVPSPSKPGLTSLTQPKTFPVTHPVVNS